MDAVGRAVAVLAEIVNRAGRAEPTTAEAVRVARVPVGLLVKAKMILAELKDTGEYGSSAVRHAAARVFD